MLRFDDENLIISDLIEMSKENVYFLTNSDFEKELYNSICFNWSNWTINNSKASFPPDYFSDKYKIMFDVLRINDSEKKKNYNPILSKERKIEKEFLERMNIPLDAHIFSLILAEPDEPYDNAHNYSQYVKMSNRVIQKHIDKIKLCKETHSGFKMGYLICDETCTYIEKIVSNKAKKDKKRLIIGNIHSPFYDKNFMSKLTTNSVDFVIWYSPNKYSYNNRKHFPKVCFIDLQNFSNDLLLDYNETKLIST